VQAAISGIRNKRTLRHAAEIFIIVYFVAYLIIGLFLVSDYGLSTDDVVQRRHSLVNYKYLNKVLLGRDILPDTQDLETYPSYYGVALQLLLVFYEDLNGFLLNTREIYLARHTMVFIVSFIGYVLFYLALRKVFPKSKWVPILGVLMISLYPRYFGGQFVDVKNRLFSATCMITFFFMVMAVEKKTPLWQILFGCSSALAVNTRMMGVFFPVLLLSYDLCVDITEVVLARKNGADAAKAPGGWKNSRVWKYVLVVVSFILFWILITPQSWQNPLRVFIATFKDFSHFERWNGTMVFMGRLIRCSTMPWYYLFVWFAISIPILYLVYFALGHISFLKQFFRSKNKWNSMITTHKWFLCSFAMFWCNVFAVIIMHSRIYIGWHHMYYVFVPMCILFCYGLEWLLSMKKLKPFVIGLTVANLIFLGVWIGQHHLWETAYFNVIGTPIADQFDRGETQPATIQLGRWILDQVPGKFTVKWNKTSYPLLTQEEKSRVTQVNMSDDPEYIIFNYRNAIGNDYTYDGYEEVYTVWISNYKVGSVYHRLGETQDE